MLKDVNIVTASVKEGAGTGKIEIVYKTGEWGMKYTNKTETVIYHIYPIGELYTFRAYDKNENQIIPEKKGKPAKVFLSEKECHFYLKSLYGKLKPYGLTTVYDDYYGGWYALQTNPSPINARPARW